MPLLDGFRYLTPPAVSPKLSAPTEHLSGQRLLDGTFSNRCHHLLKTSLPSGRRPAAPRRQAKYQDGVTRSGGEPPARRRLRGDHWESTGWLA